MLFSDVPFSEAFMFDKDKVPPMLWGYADGINDQIIRLDAEIAKTQKKCKHSWKLIMHPEEICVPGDPKRIPVLNPDGSQKDSENPKEFHCWGCNLRRKIKRFPWLPWEQCKKCGGDMKDDPKDSDKRVCVCCGQSCTHP